MEGTQWGDDRRDADISSPSQVVCSEFDGPGWGADADDDPGKGWLGPNVAIAEKEADGVEGVTVGKREGGGKKRGGGRVGGREEQAT